MKTFKLIIIICLALILLGGLALFIFIKSFDSRHFQTQLTNQLSQQLNRKVEMKKLDLSFSLFRGLFLTVQNFQITDDENFSKDTLFSVGELKLDVNVLAFLTQKKVVISSVSIDSPWINLVRNKEGILNIQALGAPEKIPSADEPKKDLAEQAADKSSPPAKKEIPHLPELLVRAIRMENGQLSFTDKVQDPPIKVELKDIDLNVVGLSSTSPFKFTLGSSIFSEEHNLQIKGQGQLDLKTLQVRLDEVKIDFDFSNIAGNELEKAVPSLKASEWGLTMKGKMDTLISQVVVGQEGLLLLAGTGKIAKAKFELTKIPITIEGGMDYEISEKDVHIPNIAFNVDQGFVTGQARLDDYLKQQKYYCNLQFKDFALKKNLPQFGPQANFYGLLNGQLKINGQGFQAEKLLTGLGGEGQINIAQGAIDNFNLLRFVLSKMTMLPKLDEILVDNLPEQYKKQLEQKGTVFDAIDIKTTLKEGNILVDRAEFALSGFSLTAQGQIDRNQNIDFKADLIIAKDLAQHMTAVVQELKVLEEEDGRLSIPLKTYGGPISGFRIFPDMEALGLKILTGKGGAQFQNLLNKALGRDEPNQNPSEPNQKEEPSPDKTINNVLDSIFK